MFPVSCSEVQSLAEMWLTLVTASSRFVVKPPLYLIYIKIKQNYLSCMHVLSQKCSYFKVHFNFIHKNSGLVNLSLSTYIYVKDRHLQQRVPLAFFILELLKQFVLQDITSSIQIFRKIFCRKY